MAHSEKPAQAITENDIETRDLKRRSFLKGLGIFTGVAFLGISAVGCKDDPVEPESDDFDFDATDPADSD